MTLKFEPKFEPPADADLKITNINHPGMMVWKNKHNNFVVAVCHFTADPKKRTEEWYKKETANLRADQIDREYNINFQSRAGQKAFWYLPLHEKIYKIKPMNLEKIPRNWRIIAALDHGSTNPTSIHIYAIDRQKRFYSVWEFYKTSKQLEDGENIIQVAARALKGKDPDNPHPLWDRVSKVIADPSIFRFDQQDPLRGEVNSIADLYRKQGIHRLYKGTNDRAAGLERVKDMLNYRPNAPEQSPHLFICSNCPNQWKELTNLVYEEIPPHLLMEKNVPEDVKKKDDHAYDDLRYALMSVDAPAGDLPDPEPEEGSLAAVEKEMDRAYDKDNEIDFL